MSSISTVIAVGGMAAYATSKVAVEQLAHVRHLELAHTGIGVRVARPERLARHHHPEVCAVSVVDAIEHRSRRVWVPYPVWLVSMCRMGDQLVAGGTDPDLAAGLQLAADGRRGARPRVLTHLVADGSPGSVPAATTATAMVRFCGRAR